MILGTEPPSVPVAHRDARRYGGALFAAAIILCAAVALVGAGPIVLRVVAGLGVLIVFPVVLVNAKINWPESTKLHESLLYSLALVIIGLMVGGLAVNQFLPLAGVARPLDRVPVIVTLLAALVVLGVWRPTRWRLLHGLPSAEDRSVPVIGWRDQALLISGIALVIGSIAGAFRLNNGASSTVTLSTLIFAMFVIVAIFRWRGRVQESTIGVTLYALSLSLLWMTSLRGWYVTGHDVQHEYRAFQLAAIPGLWNVESLQDAYNACISVTILPTIIQRVTGMTDFFIFKTVFQALFALCPVLIYLVARRFSSKAIAIIGAVYFIAFPTFMNDMPFMNRQEVAFFFLGVTLLMMTNEALPVRTRRVGLVVFGVGIILAHYSTTYVLLAILAFGWCLSSAVSLRRTMMQRRRARLHRSRDGRVLSPPVLVANWFVLLVLAGLTYLWIGPMTGTGGMVEDTVASTYNSLTGQLSGQRSGDVSTIFGGPKTSPEERLRDYSAESKHTTDEDRQDQATYPLSEVEKYPTPLVEAEELPLTAVGEKLDHVGVDVPTLNRLSRRVTLLMLQLFVAIGLVVAMAGGARDCKPSLEFVSAAAAGLTVIVLQTVMPFLTVNYGVLRTFTQALFWLAPLVALGSIQPLRFLGRSASSTFGLASGIAYFASLTGVISQMLGGYAPQLHLNNSGQYYDLYYSHPEEISAIQWLQARTPAGATEQVQSDIHHEDLVRSNMSPDRYLSGRNWDYNKIQTTKDIFPLLIRKDAYVFLGYAVVHKNEVTFLYSGDLVTYQYPIGFLDNNKSLLYSSDGVRIYR